MANLEKDSLNETIESLRADLHTRETTSSAFLPWPTHGVALSYISSYPHPSAEQISTLENTVQELRHELADWQRTANEEQDSLDEIISSLRAILHTQETDSHEQKVCLEQTIQELRDGLADSRCMTTREETSLNETIDSLRADFHTQAVNSAKKMACLEETIRELRTELANSQHKADGLVRTLCAHERKLQEEVLDHVNPK
ncbi:hypothetical protein JVU11DRAFT_10306 [Chiua virens]|nr:hypothetical protein JVU11DRAFT_10306 [Chiua virens]